MCIRDRFKEDPLQNRYIYIADSKSNPAVGESIYAKQDLAPGTMIALLSGFIMPKDEVTELVRKTYEEFDARGLHKDHEARYNTFKYRYESCKYSEIKVRGYEL